ncbi:MAG: NAD(P)/FAD-dependent oxidoreductase [Streptomycetales bacterium]
MSGRVVVVGNSIGGTRVAAELRSAGFEGQIVMVDPDPAAPYDRPPLSKQVLLGTWEPERASLGDPEAQWGVEVRHAAASRLDAAAHRIELDTGVSVTYDRLVVASGATPRRLPGPVPAEGVHVLRTMDDCLALRADIARGGPLVVIGGGFIGAEVAASARAQGLEVTIVEALPAPMAHVLGPEVGALVAELHAEHGVAVRCGLSVQQLEGRPRVTRVVLSDGTALDADCVALGIGVVPNTGWVAGSGLKVDNGLVCDAYCAADPEGSVYAVGDVSRWYDRGAGRHVRVEHWTNATEQARTVAHNIVHPGARRAHAGLPYFWSDQQGAKIQLVGHVDPGCGVDIVRGDAKRRRVAVLYREGDALRAALTVNWPRALAAARGTMVKGGTTAEVHGRLAELG